MNSHILIHGSPGSLLGLDLGPAITKAQAQAGICTGQRGQRGNEENVYGPFRENIGKIYFLRENIGKIFFFLGKI